MIASLLSFLASNADMSVSVPDSTLSARRLISASRSLMLSCTVDTDSAWQRRKAKPRLVAEKLLVHHAVRANATPAAAELPLQAFPGPALCLWLPSELAEA